MSDVLCQEGSWIAPSSQRSFAYRSWSTPSSRHLLVIVHGFGEHGGRYDHVGRVFAQGGFFVAAPDLWGHGRSGGRRGDLASVDQCARECRAMTEEVFMPMSGTTQYTLFGHSFGGLVAIQWALTHPQGPRRAVIQSPLLDVGFPIPSWKVQAAHVLSVAWPSFSFRMDLDVDALSHDASVVAAYRSDPLVHNAMSARAYCELLRARADALRRAHTLRVPILLLTGGADRIISLERARQWFNSLQCPKRQLTFPDCYHELHHERAFGEIVPLVSEWTRTDGA